MPYPIAIALLEEALERAEVDHYSDGQNTDCDGCHRAASIRREIEALKGEED